MSTDTLCYSIYTDKNIETSIMHQDDHINTPTPPAADHVRSVDDKITEENIRANIFLVDPKQERVGGILNWVTLNRPIVLGALALLLVTAAIIGFISVNHSNNSLEIATKDESSLPESDTITYSTDADETSPQTGSDTNSGTGVLSDGSGDPAATPQTPSTIHMKATATEVSISWSKIKNATQYTIQMSKSDSFQDPTTITSGDTNVVIPGLKEETDYYIRIRSVGSNGVSAWSAAQKTHTTHLTPTQAQQPLPGKVSGLTITQTSTRAIKLSWSKTSHTKTYSVIQARNSQLTSGKYEYAATSSTSYTVSDLSPGTVYYFVVRANNSRGIGSASSTVTIKMKIATPSITATTVTSSSATPTWSRQTGASKYTIQLSSSSDFKSAKTLTTTGKSVTFSAIDGGTTYYLRVRATDGKNTTSWSQTAKATTIIRVPSGLKLSSFSASSMKLSWGKSTGATRYEVRRSTSSNMSKSTSKSITSTTLTLSSLKSSTKYYIQARAFDGKRWTAWSKMISASTKKEVFAAFKIATFNILGSRHTDYSGSGWPKASVRLPRAMKVLNNTNVSVAALQEIYPDQQKMILKQYSNTWGMAMKSVSGQGRAVIWRKDTWKMLKVKYIAVPAAGTKYQAFVLLEQKKTGKRIWFMGIHNFNGTDAAARNKRERSLKTELTFIKSAKSDNYPVFIAGDFNDGPDARTSAQCILTPFMTNIFGANGPGSCGKSKADTRVDHIFYISASQIRTSNPTVNKSYTGKRVGITDHPLVIVTVSAY